MSENKSDLLKSTRTTSLFFEDRRVDRTVVEALSRCSWALVPPLIDKYIRHCHGIVREGPFGLATIGREPMVFVFGDFTIKVVASLSYLFRLDIEGKLPQEFRQQYCEMFADILREEISDE